jgi:ATP-binding cassette subfamily B protein/subfamily B ATP-binding cassette protein MsbA
MEMRVRLFEHVQKLSLAFHTRSQSGDLLMRLTGDVNNLRDLFVGILISFLTSSLVVVTIIGIMLVMDWQLTLLVLCILPLTLVVSALTGLRIRRAAHRQRRRESKISVAAHEALIGMPIIQAFGREDSAQRVFERQTRGSFREGMRVARLEALASQWTEIILALGTAIVVLWGARGVLATPPTNTPGDLLLFYFYLRTLNKPVRGYARLISRAARATASAERVMEIMRIEPDIADSPGASEAPPLRGHITLRNVHFGYGGEPVLRGVDLEIRPGEKVAIVGASGSGKSTLCSLIPRFYDPDGGQVLLDGVDVRTCKIESIRNQIAIVLQDPMLFGMSVFENIALGEPTSTAEHVERAARRAQAHGFIRMMPDGYDTVLAERGLSLSQGQKQRLALARSFLRRAAILILDEPTSNVDAKSERLIAKGIRKLNNDTTCLVITHNIRIIEHVDRVVLLDQGRITKIWTPQELVADGGLGANLRGVPETSVGPGHEIRDAG